MSSLDLSAFDFEVPAEFIAQEPLADRSASKLFVYDREQETIEHRHFFDITDYFGENDVLVLNSSKVIPARIAFEKKEIFVVSPLAEKNVWKCLVKKGKFFQVGRVIPFSDGSSAEVLEVLADGLRVIQFHTEDMEQFLEKYGEVPLPPYIHNASISGERYQTVYAAETGSVAAPTAGLHFTPEILEKLQEKGVQIEYVTLHVGPGTFLPVKEMAIEKHRMHSEYYSISEDVVTRIAIAKSKGKKVTAVGSTALRTLETAAQQKAFEKKEAVRGETALFLYPPAKFLMVDQLITNFHLPRTTLIMLVAAFLDPGDITGIPLVQKLYAEAMQEKYRFFSFGDAMFLR
jgi:S-adenosylmethionine:tRNA ribosyltransferase-isomerase